MEQQKIIDTIQMISEEKLDIRTITMGISLLDCITGDTRATAERIYDKIMHKAAHLVQVADEIETEYGIPIVRCL